MLGAGTGGCTCKAKRQAAQELDITYLWHARIAKHTGRQRGKHAGMHGCTLACNTTAASAHNESSARGVP